MGTPTRNEDPIRFCTVGTYGWQAYCWRVPFRDGTILVDEVNQNKEIATVESCPFRTPAGLLVWFGFKTVSKIQTIDRKSISTQIRTTAYSIIACQSETWFTGVD